ncbi:hypothetical protein CXB51_017440 [Gossypium anomalum]|uniref:Zinc finger, CCHC-type n=1 Tax=Gossypium anomalum TaxID=47600 RepID=A0A8J5YXT5_9ROSI|nr:hypothetical protein CXB51_017440 [Gossypium anomalum]
MSRIGSLKDLGEVDEVTAFTAVKAWKHSDFLWRNYILNGLSDVLYKVYSAKKTTKELWTSLNHKYKAEDELQPINHGILAEGMMINESFQVATIIEKLPHAWNDFKNYLKHKRKEMSVEDLIVRPQIE